MPIRWDGTTHLSPKDFILIRGARMHNLKNLNVAIPRGQLVVVTGVSGSGKSSLIVDTLLAEAQRRYMESLSAYARQFLGKIAKPAVDSIQGIAPAIAIPQNVRHNNPSTTVGTVTELVDYLCLLYARIGVTYSPISGQKVQKHSVADVVDYIHKQEEGSKILLYYPIEATAEEALKEAQSRGIARVVQDGIFFYIASLLAGQEALSQEKSVYGLVDRIIVRKDCQSNQDRIEDSVQSAFMMGRGKIMVEIVGVGQQLFSDQFELDGMRFEQPTVAFFNFNSPYGACKQCEGVGQVMGIAETQVVPNPMLSLAEGAIAPWHGPIMRKWLMPLLKHGEESPIPLHMPYSSLTLDQKNFLWKGKDDFIGIEPFFDLCATQSDSLQYRVLTARYFTKISCPSCQGSRMRADAQYVRICGYSLSALLAMPIQQLLVFFNDLSLTAHEAVVVQSVLAEITHRIRYITEMGLGHLTLNRPVNTLSVGEGQRIRLVAALGSSLCDTMYILDEPTAGLHPQDTHTLVQLLLQLKNQGNTVIVIEHEAQVMHAADFLIEIGPEGGAGGGCLVFQGDIKTFLQTAETYTASYFSGQTVIPLPTCRRAWWHSLSIYQASIHHLKAVTVAIPLQILTVVTGVSGSGKSSLINEVLYPGLVHYFSKKDRCIAMPLAVAHGCLAGDLHCIQAVELMSQHTLGTFSRSNLVSYLGIDTYIQDLFVATALARSRSYKRAHFSFNSPKGQCPNCYGSGTQKIAMQFMADIYLPCETCQGNRFKPEILDVTYADKDIAQLLRMTVDEALCFFAAHAMLCVKLKALDAIGLGYIHLDQSIGSLSGGECQRLKLAYYLAKNLTEQPILFILDEPTTGLHFRDVHTLVIALHALVQQGHTVIVLEHHMDIIKNADWIIDLGPGGGDQGGRVVFTGTPEELVQVTHNATAHYLRQKM